MREGAGMPSSTAVGTAQSRVLADVRQNGCHLRALMEQAAAAGARVVHFPEVALSGCVKAQMRPSKPDQRRPRQPVRGAVSTRLPSWSGLPGR
jgi:predicted amidohydrolase